LSQHHEVSMIRRRLARNSGADHAVTPTPIRRLGSVAGERLA